MTWVTPTITTTDTTWSWYDEVSTPTRISDYFPHVGVSRGGIKYSFPHEGPRWLIGAEE